MAKKKEKNWKEAELITTFGLTRAVSYQTPLMSAWLNTPNILLDNIENTIFEKIYYRGLENIAGWSEEDLKMKFISPILDLGEVLEGKGFVSFFEKILEGEVKGHYLKVKADFIIAKGLLNHMELPYFHFQEYKPHLNPTGEPMAQVLEAMLIAQTHNNNNKPIYGCEITGGIWRFIVLENTTYCISKSYDATDKEDLLKIIAVLRKFKNILEEDLLK